MRLHLSIQMSRAIRASLRSAMVVRGKHHTHTPHPHTWGCSGDPTAHGSGRVHGPQWWRAVGGSGRLPPTRRMRLWSNVLWAVFRQLFSKFSSNHFFVRTMCQLVFLIVWWIFCLMNVWARALVFSVCCCVYLVTKYVWLYFCACYLSTRCFDFWLILSCAMCWRVLGLRGLPST